MTVRHLRVQSGPRDVGCECMVRHVAPGMVGGRWLLRPHIPSIPCTHQHAPHHESQRPLAEQHKSHAASVNTEVINF